MLERSEIQASSWGFQEISFTLFWLVQKGFSGRGLNPDGKGGW